MSYKYSKPRTSKEKLKDLGWLALIAFLVLCVVIFVLQLGFGWGVQDKDVICNKGGEAYWPVGNHLYRIASKDAACVKGRS